MGCTIGSGGKEHRGALADAYVRSVTFFQRVFSGELFKESLRDLDQTLGRALGNPLKGVPGDPSALLGMMGGGGIAGVVKKAASGIAKGGAAEGKSVLGHYPEYKSLAESLSARRFNIPESVWNKMSEAERWGANQKFLDRMISRGDDVILATPLDKVRPGSYFARELEYMSGRGYGPSTDGTRLILQRGR